MRVRHHFDKSVSLRHSNFWTSSGIKQAAAYCSCSVLAIREVIWSRELPACKIGKRYLIDRGDLDRFIDARLRERTL